MKDNNEKHIKLIRKELKITLNEERKTELRTKLKALKKEIAQRKDMLELVS